MNTDAAAHPTITGDIGHLHEDKKKRKRKRLGRHIHHDPRSLQHQVKFTEEQKAAPLVSKRWHRHIPVLDQGDLGSCTANAATGMLACDPFFADAMANMAEKQAHLVKLDELFAVRLYEQETKIDGIRGEYPPEDTGSTGLAACKALKNLGLIDAYEHCFGVDDVLRHLSFKGPVILGINWRAGMDKPRKDGLVRFKGKLRKDGLVRFKGKLEGGHEIVADEINVEKKLVWFTNSWGTLWGVAGRFCMTFDDVTKALLDDGDAMTAVIVPVGMVKVGA